MTSRERELAAIARLRRRAMAGDSFAVSNIAAGYRILGRRTLAFRWWKRGAEAGDGSDMLEVAYCYHHGIGVRKNAEAAARFYQAAIRSSAISQFEKEEAMYHLAVLLLATPRKAATRSRVIKLLRQANVDADYPQAVELLASMASPEVELCACRRGLRPGLGRIYCNRHRWRLPNGASQRALSSKSR
jgi:TPR repeat protein